MRPERTPAGAILPDFPWDTLAAAQAKAAAHPEGIINLSVGTPVDPVAESIQQVLAANAAAPGYPQTVGLPALRDALVAASARRFGITGLTVDSVLPVIGTKEAIAWLPLHLGIGAGHTVVIPPVAYPTYEVAALLAGATVVRATELAEIKAANPSLVFINSPSNPTGAVLSSQYLKELVEWAQENQVIIASDECYLGLNWSPEPVYSLLHPKVCGGNHQGLLLIQSLSKTSNLASYRAGYLAGDPQLIAELLLIRKHTGLMMPGPIQHAFIAALEDDEQERAQYQRYARRREVLLPALQAAGFEIAASTAGLYLWATRGEDCDATVDFLASLGILVAPGKFYGPESGSFIRMALTASDAQIDAAAQRLRAAAS